MRVDWCVSSWFRIKNTHSLTPVREGETIEGSRTMRNRPYQVLIARVLNQAHKLYTRLEAFVVGLVAKRTHTSRCNLR